uniref:NLP effector protein Pc553546 n=1 Tax=Phytophthora capsici TaxID=4784 RepID=NLP46_PHYCP|nr:Nep1-like protein Pc553546 [Phytophthora capsici]|eukprot:jgi/Phyca11/553546/estExt2_Genewise1Plus.C_PHYCAscaffold_530322
MNLVAALVLCFALLSSVRGDDTTNTIDHDQVKPFPQPEPVTISEKAAVKYKPQLEIGDGCVSFPAVNAAGEITGGLKGTKDTEACTEAPLGSQVYGRSTWFQDKWAMMYSWYFPKNFCAYKAAGRHDWANVVIWIDNPAAENVTFLGASLSQQTLEPIKLAILPMGTRNEEPYQNQKAIPMMAFAGAERITTGRVGRWSYTYKYVAGSNTTMRFSHSYPGTWGWIDMTFADSDGESQDLIMWNQLTDKARAALESADFGDTQVPFTDKNFDTNLQAAWPF